MVKINRSPLPSGQTITRESDYRTGPLYELLKNDFNEKCYICEDKAAKHGIEIDHLKAHHGDNLRKYDWNNLFFSCHHCNRLKNDDFDTIIDCTRDDPEDYFNLAINTDTFIKTEVTITKIKDSPHIDETIRLLDRVYNGEAKPIMRDECIELRKDIRENMRKFSDLLTCYAHETDDGIKSAFAALILVDIDRKSPFAAFKRSIVRNDSALLLEFKTHSEG
jgi:uncharacterized protein (TIGR02646 family)